MFLRQRKTPAPLGAHRPAVDSQLAGFEPPAPRRRGNPGAQGARLQCQRAANFVALDKIAFGIVVQRFQSVDALGQRQQALGQPISHWPASGHKKSA